MSYRKLSSIVLPEESTIEPTIEEKNNLIRSILTRASELAVQEEFWNELKKEARKLALEEANREKERETEQENKLAKEKRELAEREEFWIDIKRQAQNLALAEEQRKKRQNISKIQALDPLSLAKLIHYIHKQDKSLLHSIEDSNIDFIRSIYSPNIKFNNNTDFIRSIYSSNIKFNKEHFRPFNNTITDTITANKNIAGYKRKSKRYKSKHYKSKHKRYKNTNSKINRQFRRTIRRLNKKTKKHVI